MTKKAEKEQEVQANKKTAYVNKVRNLTGHVFERMNFTALNAAFEAGVTASDYAVSIVAREPVGLAIHPLKVDAVKRAHEMAKKIVDDVRNDLEAHDMDRDAAAPYPPRSMHYNDPNRENMVSKHNLYSMLTTQIKYPSPIVEMVPDYINRFISNAESNAAAQYDSFICKLVAKVGEVTTATIEGNHVWGYSILSVVTKDGKKQNWKTQQIVNVSKLGNFFNQWPTRLMK